MTNSPASDPARDHQPPRDQDPGCRHSPSIARPCAAGVNPPGPLDGGMLAPGDPTAAEVAALSWLDPDFEPWPGDPERLALAMSAVGVWLTEDGGETWSHGNAGLAAGYLPEGEHVADELAAALTLTGWAAQAQLELSRQLERLPHTAGLLAAGIICGIAGLFPAYLAGSSLTSSASDLIPHVFYLAGWTASLVLILLGGARLKVGVLLSLGLSIVTFGLFFADAGQVIAGGSHLLGAGLALSLIGWLACAAGSVVALPLGAGSFRRSVAQIRSTFNPAPGAQVPLGPPAPPAQWAPNPAGAQWAPNPAGPPASEATQDAAASSPSSAPQAPSVPSAGQTAEAADAPKAEAPAEAEAPAQAEAPAAAGEPVPAGAVASSAPAGPPNWVSPAGPAGP